MTTETVTKPSLFDCTPEELTGAMVAAGYPVFRATQVLQWLYREFVADPRRMANLPVPLKAWLSQHYAPLPLRLERTLDSEGGDASRVLLALPDGETIESVLMRQRQGLGTRLTVCVSSQAGCALGCVFCATGQAGFRRHLTAGEIVAQVWDWGRQVRAETPPARIDNVVFMGQGEPLANFDQVWKAVEILTSPYALGLGARSLTISTAGVVPGILALAEKRSQVNLAVSLHAPTNELRTRLVPLNRKYPLAELLAACRHYLALTNRRITFEYVMIRGVNDQIGQAQALADLLDGMLVHVNLIPLNPTAGLDLEATPPAEIDRFADQLRGRGLNTTVRRTRGRDVQAACGQLRGDEPPTTAARRRAERARPDAPRPAAPRPPSRRPFPPRAAAPSRPARGSPDRPSRPGPRRG